MMFLNICFIIKEENCLKNIGFYMKREILVNVSFLICGIVFLINMVMDIGCDFLLR